RRSQGCREARSDFEHQQISVGRGPTAIERTKRAIEHAQSYAMAYSGPCAVLSRNLVIGRKHSKMRSRPIATATSGIGTASPNTRTRQATPVLDSGKPKMQPT